MKDKIKPRVLIQQKITIFIIVVSFVIGFISLSLMYWSRYNLLRQTIGRDYMTMSRLLSDAMDRIISREIKSTEVFMGSGERLQKVQESNLKYEGMSKEQKEAYFKDMDERWLKASDDDPLITGYTKSPAANRLKEIVVDDPTVAEIFMTDKYGGLVAASDKTTDFYQADEEWWQKSFNHGQGDVFVEDIGFDLSSKTTGIAIAVPIKSRIKKEVIGVFKNYLEIKRLLSPLENFRIGKSGHVALIDKQGYLIFHSGIEAMTEKLPDNIFKKIISHNNGYLVVSGADNLHKKKSFLSYFKIDQPELLKSGIEWWICIVQDNDEVFSSLRGLVFSFILVALIMFAVVLILGSYFGSILVKPIIKLRDVTEKAAKGNLDYKVEIKSNDEIGDLADSFNSMLSSLKSSFTTIDKLNEEMALRKKIEESLQKSEEQYRTLFMESRDAVMTLLPDQGFLSGNPAAIKMFGCRDEEDFIKRSPAEMSPEFQPDGSKSIDKAREMMVLAIEKGSNLFEWTHKRLDGVEFFSMVLLSRFKISSKTFLQATVRDISEHKRMLDDLEKKNEELLKLDRLKTDFVSIVSHELRTPLSITKEGISLVLDGVAGNINPKQNEILTTSRDNINRLARIINSLLDISTIESGRVDLKKKDVDFEVLIKNVATSFEARIKEKGLELKINLTKAGGVILYIDEDKIIQVLTNLINNAIKFTQKGSISVTLVEKENEVECVVGDTGIGITKEELPKVFNKFMQFGRTFGAGEKGTGLGLSITKGLIDLHRGHIWVESEINRGTRFIFTLPRYSIDQRARDQIEDAIKNALRAGTFFSLIIGTLRYSDKVKAKISDEVSVELEKIIIKQLRNGKDLFSKFADESFIILQDCNKNCALIVQGRIQQALGSYFSSIHLGEDVKIDFGIATYPDEAGSYQELINKAKAGLGGG